MGVDVAAAVPQLLKVLGEPMRWAIVSRLASEDLCTCHLVDEIGAAQPLVSHHLRVLREAGIVRSEPAGAFTYYVLERHVLADVAGALGAVTDPAERPRRRPCS